VDGKLILDMEVCEDTWKCEEINER